TNFAASTGTLSGGQTVNQAMPAVVVDPVSATYDGQPHGTTGRVVGVNGVSLGAATITYNTGDGNAPAQAGSYVATGSFAGDTNYAPASGTAPIVIAPASTTTKVVSSAAQSSFGQSVTFTATVTPATGQATPTGTVTFLDGLKTLGTRTLGASGTVA